MSQRKNVVIVLLATVLVAAALLPRVESAREASNSSSQVSIGIDGLPAAAVAKTSDELIAFWHDRYQRSPQDYVSLTYLGHSYINKARETGDAETYGRAEAALQQALALNPDYEAALAYLSTVLFVQHDFAGALALANRVYAFDPNALHALATIGDAQLELGHYAEAEAAYRELQERNPSPPVYARLARIEWLNGRPEAALSLMQQAADEAVGLGMGGESAAWYHVQLGELSFNSGKAEVAQTHYAEALSLFDDYYLALAGMGKALAALGDYEAAIEHYERVIALNPQPDFIAALGDLYLVTGKSDSARRQFETIAFVAELETINQVIYNRQLALYYANHDLNLDHALALAEGELEVRQDIYGYDTLAWTLYKNGRFVDAAAASDRAMEMGALDAVLYYHAGMIYAELGDRSRAIAMLEKALALNPHFDLLQAQVARTTLKQLQTTT